MKSRSRKGSKNNNWKGGRLLTNYGYVLILMPEHPRADQKDMCANIFLWLKKYSGNHFLRRLLFIILTKTQQTIALRISNCFLIKKNTLDFIKPSSLKARHP